jgi:tripartite-type tricarboxylate transporter receptor subunit TctC
LIGRRIAQKLSEQFKIGTVVENKSGAGSLIGTEFVANAPADGYTLMIGGLANMVMNKALIKNLSYDPDRDFVPLGYISGYSFVFLTRPEMPVNSLAEFVKFAKQQKNQFCSVRLESAHCSTSGGRSCSMPLALSPSMSPSRGRPWVTRK